MAAREGRARSRRPTAPQIGGRRLAAGARQAAALRIGERLVGRGQPCYIVAEAGSAHGGDLAQGFELIFKN